MLSDEGLNVITAASGREAIKILFDYPPDYFVCILMGIEMPGLNGYETAEIIRENPKYKDCIIIAASADVPRLEDKEIICMDDYIVKPLDIEKLMKCMNRKVI